MMNNAGRCLPGFATVRDAFEAAVDGAPAGSALAVWHDGRMIIDLWGGPADVTGRPWASDTLVMPYSVGKPLAAVCVLLLAERGLVDIDSPMRRYWPEMRSDATVRHVLSHSAGLVLLDEPAPAWALMDWEDLCRRLARQPSSWIPGTAVGESALFYGHLLGEIVRRVDGRSLGTFLRDEIAGPHGLDIHVGILEHDLPRVADLAAGPDFSRAGGGPLRAAATSNPPGTADMSLVNSREWRTAEVPAINAHVTARAMASFYVVLAAGQILPSAILAEMCAVQASGQDLVTGEHAQWGLGVAVDYDGWGMGGIGGSFACWSEAGQYAFAFVTADLGTFERVDAIETALRSTLDLPPLTA